MLLFRWIISKLVGKYDFPVETLDIVWSLKMVNVCSMFCPVTYASTLCSYKPWHECILKHQVKSKGQVVVH